MGGVKEQELDPNHWELVGKWTFCDRKEMKV